MMSLRPGVRARARGGYRWRVDCGLMRVLLLVLRSVHQHQDRDIQKTLTRSCSSVVPEMTSRFPCIFAILPSGQIPAHPLPIPVRQLGISATRDDQLTGRTRNLLVTFRLEPSTLFTSILSLSRFRPPLLLYRYSFGPLFLARFL
jgi:hypothetical protein